MLAQEARGTRQKQFTEMTAKIYSVIENDTRILKIST